MIVGVFGCPGATKLHWTFMFEALGASFLFVSTQGECKVTKPSKKRMFTATRLVLCQDAYAFFGVQERLIRSGFRYCVFVAGNPLLLEEAQLPVWAKDDVDKQDVLSFDNLLTAAPMFARLTDNMANVKGIYVTDTSVVQRCHTLFYRVADKDARSKLQKAVWNYLSGKTSKVPTTGINALDVLLRNEFATKLREHAIKAKEIGIEKAIEELGADEFELQYLIHKSSEE